MNRPTKWIGKVAVVGLTLLLSSCSNSDGVTEPDLSASPVVVSSRSGQRFVVAVERNPEAGRVSARIGPSGGILKLGTHSLIVSRNAVDRPTLFTMSRDRANPLMVRLTAGREAENDVGAAGFNAPVYLALSFHGVQNLPHDTSLITILLIQPDGSTTELETSVRIFGKVAVAQIPHFSLFCLAWP